MDNEQTTKQIPKLDDTERLKELFEYEMTQVRLSFRKELLDINDETKVNPGKDVLVPECKGIETPACHVDESSVEYTYADLKAAMARELPDEQADFTVNMPEVHMPDVPQNMDEKMQAASETVSAPVKTELTLPAVVNLDSVKQAGDYQSQPVSGFESKEQEQLASALSVLEQIPTQDALAEIAVAESSEVTIAEIGMEQIQSWHEVQTAVPQMPELTVPELNVQKYETPDVQVSASGDISVPDINMTKATEWSSVDVAVSEIQLKQQLPDLQAQTDQLSQASDLDISVKTEVQKLQVPDMQSVSVPDVSVVSAQVSMPEFTLSSGISISVPSADIQQMKAKSPDFPELPDISVPEAAVSDVSIPQQVLFDRIQSDMQQVLQDAVSIREAGNELLAEFQQAANS